MGEPGHHVGVDDLAEPRRAQCRLASGSAESGSASRKAGSGMNSLSTTSKARKALSRPAPGQLGTGARPGSAGRLDEARRLGRPGRSRGRSPRVHRPAAQPRWPLAAVPSPRGRVARTRGVRGGRRAERHVGHGQLQLRLWSRRTGRGTSWWGRLASPPCHRDGGQAVRVGDPDAASPIVSTDMARFGPGAGSVVQAPQGADRAGGVRSRGLLGSASKNLFTSYTVLSGIFCVAVKQSACSTQRKL